MINKKYLPSKNFIRALIIAIFLVVAVIILNYWKPSTTKYDNNNLVAVSDANASSSVMNIDSDGDGLPDWKEALYGTDPHKADTDGDGTSDYDEIIQNRDPLKANTAPAGQEPNDKIDSTVVAKDQETNAEYEKLNTTEKMARNLLSNILASQPTNGQTIDQDTMNSIVKKSLDDIPQKQYNGITKISDLNIVPINLSTFNQQLNSYKINYYNQTEKFRNIYTDDLTIIVNYMKTGTDSKKAMLAITSQYQDIINNLVKMPIPSAPSSDGITFHLALINDMEKLIQIDNDAINTDYTDAASIFSYVIVYNSTITEISLILDKIDTILNIQR